MAKGLPLGQCDEPTVRRLWWAALETLQEDILGPMELKKGLWLAAPLPALYEPKLLDRFKGWVWAPDQLESLQFSKTGFLLPSRTSTNPKKKPTERASYIRFPLLEMDGSDPFLMIITPELQVALALQGQSGKRKFLIRSDQETISDLLEMLDQRLKYEAGDLAAGLREELAALGQLQSSESLEKVFWPLLSERLAYLAPTLAIQTFSESTTSEKHLFENSGEISLLEALTHEIRTPLATIRTLIRSLLKRNNFNPIVINRLKQIDAVCTEQIDRFGLIFNAAELQRENSNTSNLASTDLGRMLEILHQGWSEQLEHRGIKVILDITPDLPKVLSDPQRLELMLGGLIDRNTRGLKSGGIVVLELRPAGQRLKLQILNQLTNDDVKPSDEVKPDSALGPVLSWNPGTGSLQLSKAATQRLLASLGGRLTHRRDSGMTVFFPISEVKN